VADSTEYQVTYWRDLPSLVVAREGDHVTKSQLAPRFQEAIDEAAMRLGDTSSDEYLAGWRRSDWMTASGSSTDVADRVVAGLDGEWPPDRLEEYLDSLGPSRGSA
jgi:FAD/FMN-containing dehydrogenase